jgi:hypothetical protein
MTLDPKAVKLSWQRLYKAGLDADVWGQADEAQSSYHKLAQSLVTRCLTYPSPPSSTVNSCASVIACHCGQSSSQPIQALYWTTWITTINTVWWSSPPPPPPLLVLVLVVLVLLFAPLTPIRC